MHADTDRFYLFLAEGHIFVIAGFLLAVLLVINILRQKGTPSGMSAWILIIIFAPYIGVPLYLIFHGRKLRRIIDTKKTAQLLEAHYSSVANTHPIDLMLRGYDIPGACGDNQIDFLTTGDETYHRLVELISKAKYSIYIATYVFKNDKVGRALIKLLVERAEAGIEVKILVDRFGSWALRFWTMRPIIKSGGAVELFMPMIRMPFRGRTNLRNHRKIAVFDGETVWTGGANLAAEYLGPGEDPKQWVELSYIIQGPAVEIYLEIFRSDWEFATLKHDQFEPRSFQQRQQLFPKVRQNILQVVPSGPDVAGDPLYHALLAATFYAQKKLWIMTPYFIPDELLLTALSMAARRKIDITIIVPKRSNHLLADFARTTYLVELAKLGVNVLCLEGRMLHAKALLMDDQLTIVGSANIDARSLLLNFEVATISYDQQSIATLDHWMQSIAQKCVHYETHLNPLYLFISNSTRLIAPVL